MIEGSVMLISSFIPQLNNTAINTRQNQSLPVRNYSNLAPLKQDTVSFGATVKKKQPNAHGINLITAKKLCEEAKDSNKYLNWQLNKILGDMVRPESGQGSFSKPIEAIRCRLKDPKSVVEKSATRKWYSADEVKQKMTDIAGARIVMADTSVEAVDSVLERLTEAVKNNQLRILEIENYRPEPEVDKFDNIIKKYDYSSTKALKDLKQACDNQGKVIKKTDEDMPSGYMAIHMLVQLPNGFTGEIQLMGVDVERFKDVEDICFKIKNGKHVDKKYAPLEKMLKPLTNDDDEILQSGYQEYTRRAYMAQRDIEVVKHRGKKTPEFLHIPEDLDYIPQKLDFNNIAKEIQNCDLIAKLNAE